jgi:hypothetical protein
MKKFINWLVGIKKYLLYLSVFIILSGIATVLYTSAGTWWMIGFLILAFAALIIIPAILRSRDNKTDQKTKVVDGRNKTERALLLIGLIVFIGAMSFTLYNQAPKWSFWTFLGIVIGLFIIFLLDKLFEKIFKKNT